jgi:hypothetical protein
VKVNSIFFWDFKNELLELFAKLGSFEDKFRREICVYSIVPERRQIAFLDWLELSDIISRKVQEAKIGGV